MAATKKKSLDIQPVQQPSIVLQLLNRYFRWVLFLVVGGTLLISYTFVIADQVNEIRDIAENSLIVKEKVLSDLKAIKQDLDKTVIDFSALKSSRRAAIERLNDFLPTSPHYEELFTMINDITERAGMTLTTINLSVSESDLQRPTRASVEGAAEPADLLASGQIHPITISISVEGGTYTTFKEYLSLLERNLRVLDVRSLSLDGSAFIPAGDGALPTPAYSIELITYYE
ncbi:MAG: hypothetical protein AAB490_01305 [Patescibacteria group bacterium]